MKKAILILTAITTLFLGACKKDKDNTPGDSGTYQPFTKNSVWKYRTTTQVGGVALVDTTTNTMADSTKTLNGRTFHITLSTDGDDTTSVYIGLNNHVYSTFFNIDEDNAFEIAYLNDTKAAGESWEAATTVDIDGDEVEAKLKTTIVEKGISKTIADKPYSNIIHSKVELQAKLAGTFQTISTIDYYVAKNIGVVGTYVKVGTAETAKSELFSYTIK
ncbi:MAG: hypothetical protein ABIP28_00385 [Mucilaginibacter sp.]